MFETYHPRNTLLTFGSVGDEDDEEGEEASER